jgi:hypothetical protein
MYGIITYQKSLNQRVAVANLWIGPINLDLSLAAANEPRNLKKIETKF